MIQRRTLLRGLVGLLAASAIVRASSLMPARSFIDRPDPRIMALLEARMADAYAIMRAEMDKVIWGPTDPNSTDGLWALVNG